LGRFRLVLVGATLLFGIAASELALALGDSKAWNSFEPSARQTVINEVDRNIRQHFAHWQALGDFDYDAAFARYRQAALTAPDRRSFSLLTEAFVASLNNGHTQFNDPLLYRSDPGNLGFRLSYVGGEWVVTLSAREELPVGSILKEIDGRSFESFYLDVRKQLNASNDRTRRSGLTSYAALFPKAFTLKLDDGAKVAIDRAGIKRSFPPQSLVAHRWLDEGAVAYVAIRRFSDPEAERQARDLVTGTYAAAKYFIIDLRGNGGGSTPGGLGRAMLGSEWRGWLTQQPDARIMPSTRSLPSQPRYIVIIDRGCGSACEDFVMPFSLSSKAVLVGETTGGSSGQPKIKDWPNGMNLWVGSRRQWFPDGREFEGVGIAPDIPIDLIAADFRAGSADRMLVCARAIAGGNRDGSCQPGIQSNATQTSN
jgi:carboxyl-terminal processing protease